MPLAPQRLIHKNGSFTPSFIDNYISSIIDSLLLSEISLNLKLFN